MSIASDFSAARALLAAALGITAAAIKDDASIDNVEEWDSLAHVRLVFELEQRLKRELSPLEIADLTNVIEIEKILAPGAA